jgi:ribosomal protein L40E
MNQVFGWKQGSDMPSVYVHLSGRDLDDAMLGVYGLKKIDEEKPKLTPKICPRYNTSNPIDARFCTKCGLALDVKAAAEMEEARVRTDSMMDVLMRDPEFKEFLLRKLKDLGPSPL